MAKTKIDSKKNRNQSNKVDERCDKNTACFGGIWLNETRDCNSVSFGSVDSLLVTFLLHFVYFFFSIYLLAVCHLRYVVVKALFARQKQTSAFKLFACFVLVHMKFCFHNFNLYTAFTINISVLHTGKTTSCNYYTGIIITQVSMINTNKFW